MLQDTGCEAEVLTKILLQLIIDEIISKKYKVTRHDKTRRNILGAPTNLYTYIYICSV